MVSTTNSTPQQVGFYNVFLLIRKDKLHCLVVNKTITSKSEDRIILDTTHLLKVLKAELNKGIRIMENLSLSI